MKEMIERNSYSFMRKLFYMFLLFAFAGAIAACDNLPQITLDTPTNVVINDGVLTWNAVSGAESYTIVVGMSNHTATGTSFDLKTLTLEEGSYQVSVIAVAGDKVSIPSSLVSYVVSVSEPTTLAAPTNVVITNGVVTWNEVTNALTYVVIVNSVEHSTTVRTFDLNGLFLNAGDYTITVKAVRNTLVSPASASVSFNVVALSNPDAIYESLLVLADPDYVPGLEEDDFENDWEYNSYKTTSMMMKRYSEVAVDLMMTEDDAVDMFTFLLNAPEWIELIENATTLIEQVDELKQFGLTNEKVTHMLLELGLVAIDIQKMGLEDEIDYLESDMIETENRITLLKQSAAYLALYNKLSGYATPENLTLLQEYIARPFSQQYHSDALGWIGEIVHDVIYNSDDPNPWYLEYDAPYTGMFYQIVKTAKTSNDFAFLMSLDSNFYDVMRPLFELRDEKWNLFYTAESMTRLNSEVVQLTKIQQMYVDERPMMISSVLLVMDYMTTVYDSIPASLITSIDTWFENGELSLAEYVVLKDEIIQVLDSTLPSAQDFTNMYLAMMRVGNLFTEVPLNQYDDKAALLGQLDVLVFDLLFDFLADIDQTMIEEVIEIIDDMFLSSSYVQSPYGYGMRGYDRVDFRKMVELLVYIGTYLNEFKNDQALKITAIELLMNDDVIEEIAMMIADIAKANFPDYMDEEERAFASSMIDQMVAEVPYILEGLDVLGEIGNNAITEFLTTEGLMFMTVVDLIDAMESGQMDLMASIDLFETLISQAIPYNTAIAEELDVASLTKVIRMLKWPISMSFYRYMGVDAETNPLEELFDDLLQPIATILYNAITMEQHILNVLDGADFSTLLAGLESIETEEGLIPVLRTVVFLLEEVLTPDMENLVFASMTIVFDDLMKHPTILTQSDMTPEDVDAIHLQVRGDVEEVFDQIHDFATYDFDQLTEEEFLALMDFFESYFPKKSEQGMKIGFISTSWDVYDGYYNQAAWEGILMFADEYQVVADYFYPTEISVNGMFNAIQMAVNSDCTIIVTAGWLFAEAVYMAQDAYPDVQFIMVDDYPHSGDYNPVVYGNTTVIHFKEEQAGFLAGYAAVMDGYTELGFMGGMSVPAVKRFGIGYVAGAYFAASELEIPFEFASNRFQYLNTFAPSQDIVTQAQLWYASGTEVIFGAAGGAGYSIIYAAEMANDVKWVIGVDVDQNDVSDVILTSAMKDIAKVIALTLELAIFDEFPGGQMRVLGIDDEAIRLSYDLSRFEQFGQYEYNEIMDVLSWLQVPSNAQDLAQFVVSLGMILPVGFENIVEGYS